MSATGRYDVIETPVGWRVVEHTTGRDKVHVKAFRTEAAARSRAATLTAAWLYRNACAEARKRAKNRCECRGECQRGHPGRCELLDGESDRIPGGPVVLKPVAINHNNDDLRPDNIRLYCQLCRQRHDAEAAGGEALFDIEEVTR